MPIVNYVREHIRFMEYATDEHLTASERLLWYALMHVFNQRAQGKVWPDEFIRISNDRLLSFCPMKYDTIASARNSLKQRGLIEYTKGEKNKLSPAYRMIYFYPESVAPDTETDVNPQSNTENSDYKGGNMGGNIGYNTGGNMGGNRGGNTGDNNINYTGNRRIPDRYQRDWEDDEEEQEEAAARARARAEAAAAWKENFGKEATPAMLNALTWRAVNFGFEEGVLTKAIEASAFKGAASPMDYVVSVICDWAQNKVKTVQDVEEYSFVYDAYNGRVQNIGVSISEGIDMMRAFRQDRETDEERDARERYEARQEAELEERRRKIAENKADREKEEYQREKERLDRKYGVTA